MAEEVRSLFWFDVIVPSGPGGTVLSRHQEYGLYPGRKRAWKRFWELVAPANKAGCYYLCSWGSGPFPEDRLFGSATPSPQAATYRDYNEGK